MTEKCELLTRAERLAKRRNLPVDKLVCPIINTCDGLECIFFRKMDRQKGVVYNQGVKIAEQRNNHQ